MGKYSIVVMFVVVVVVVVVVVLWQDALLLQFISAPGGRDCYIKK